MVGSWAPRRAPTPLSSVREHHRVVIAGGHLHDIGRREQLLRCVSMCGIAQAQLSVVVVTRRPRLHSHTASERTQRTATSAVQVQCEQCMSSAASGRYISRQRATQMITTRCGASCLPKPATDSPAHPSTPRVKRRTSLAPARPHTEAPLARAGDGKR